MDYSIIKTLEKTAEQADGSGNKLAIIILAIVFVIALLVLFVYLASCIIIVKQGTRKIVERFGSYNRTLKEGIHIIFRPFDRIAPVPWNILSISERDEFVKNRASQKVRFFNDETRLRGSHGRANASEAEDAKLQIKKERLVNDAAKKIRKDVRILTREKYIDLEKDISKAYTDALDIDEIIQNKTGKPLNSLIQEVIKANDSIDELTKCYRSLGFDPYNASPEVIAALRELDDLDSRYEEYKYAHDRDALAASVKYYPRHQDPHSRHAKFYSLAENHVQDFVDLRERHIDTSSPKVRDRYINTSRFTDGFETFEFHERGEDFNGVKLITKDNASIGANIVIFFSITDPFLYYYGVDEPEESLVLLAISTLRNIVSGFTLEEVLLARTEINRTIRNELDIATNNWGIKANRVEIKEFELKQDMQDAMNDVLIAERYKRAETLRSDVLNKIKTDGNMGEYMKLKSYETLGKVSEGSANKVFIPSDLTDFITGAHVVADAFKDAKKEDKSEK